MNAIKSAGLVYDAVRVADLIDVVPEPVWPAGVPGFVTFYDPGWSLVQLRGAVVKRGSIIFLRSWYDNEPFARLEVPPRYRQICMTVVPNSFDKAFTEQRLPLPPDEEVPSARVVVMGMVIHFLATGERLFADHFVRCTDEYARSRRVYVGNFDNEGLHIGHSWDDDRHSDIGLASSRTN